MKAKPLTASIGKGLNGRKDGIKNCLNPTIKPCNIQDIQVIADPEYLEYCLQESIILKACQCSVPCPVCSCNGGGQHG